MAEGTGGGNSAYVMHVAFLNITDLSSAAKWGYVTVENKAKKVKKREEGFCVRNCARVCFAFAVGALSPACIPIPTLARGSLRSVLICGPSIFSFSICSFLVL